MAVSHQLDTDRKIVHFIAEGDVGVEEVVAEVNEIMARPEFSPGYDALIDICRLVPAVSVDHLKMKGLGAFIKSVEEEFGRARWAFYAPGFIQSSFAFLLKQLVGSRTIEMRIFSDLSGARGWLEARGAQRCS